MLEKLNRVLIDTITDHTKVLFYNFTITLKTCDMDCVLCGMPVWKHCYHALHSLDQWYINPAMYDEPPFHTPKLNSLDEPAGDRALSREQLMDYFETIQVKIFAYLASLGDSDLYETPPGCEYNRLSLILGQFRHFYAHLGNINATTIAQTNQWPRVCGMYWLDRVEKNDVDDYLYE